MRTEITPLRVLIDTSAIRNVEKDDEYLALFKTATSEGKVEFIVSRTCSAQLWNGSRAGKGGGTPAFSVSYCGNTVARAGLLAAGDSLGRGESFDTHLGNARSDSRVADALIVDAAAQHADAFVSDDDNQTVRARSALPSRVKVMSLQELVRLLSQEERGVDEEPKKGCQE